MNVVTESTKKNSELVERIEVKDTPFTIVKVNGEFFGTMGKYRITEPVEDLEECKKSLEGFNWNRVMQVVMLLVEELTVGDGKEI